MTTVIAVPDQNGLPAGARQLGVRVKPIIRLGLGVKHPEKGYPMKTDYLTVRGDDRAVAKFYAEYGEKPKAVEILLPSDIDIALTIQYRAFKGGQGGEGGTLVGLGHTNFARRDYCGGADTLTVWNQDGTVTVVETAGLDANTRQPLDDIAKDLGLEMYTTFRAGMPRVLGFGSYFDVSTKGKESTDNLWAKLRELYGLFGSRVSFAVKPQMVLRESKARPVVKDKESGQMKRTTTKIWVLDVVVPETIDEMIGRLQDRAVLLPGNADVSLYGPQAAIEAAPPAVAQTIVVDALTGLPEYEQIEDGEYEEPVVTEAEDAIAAEAALAAVIPVGKYKGKTLKELLEMRPLSNDVVRKMLAHQWNGNQFEAALVAAVTVHAPDLLDEVLS